MEDFNDYVNSEWESNNEIPGDWSSWNSFTIAIEETSDKLKGILETLRTRQSLRVEPGDAYRGQRSGRQDAP